MKCNMKGYFYVLLLQEAHQSLFWPKEIALRDGDRQWLNYKLQTLLLIVSIVYMLVSVMVGYIQLVHWVCDLTVMGLSPFRELYVTTLDKV